MSLQQELEGKNMRLDKFLVQAGVCSRSEAKNYIKKGLVSINDIPCKSSDTKIDEHRDIIRYKGELIGYQQYYYYMLHKPAGVITATIDTKDQTVMDLLNEAQGKDLSPVGRLDKDTEGLLLITNDGELAHFLLSPKRHVDKTYLVHTKYPVSQEAAKQLISGVDIGEKEITKPAKVEIVDKECILLTICEGKFHQVKRMLVAVDNEVTYLKRISFGSLVLDETLPKGAYRALTEEEIEALRGCIK